MGEARLDILLVFQDSAQHGSGISMRKLIRISTTSEDTCLLHDRAREKRGYISSYYTVRRQAPSGSEHSNLSLTG